MRITKIINFEFLDFFVVGAHLKRLSGLLYDGFFCTTILMYFVFFGNRKFIFNFEEKKNQLNFLNINYFLQLGF